MASWLYRIGAFAAKRHWLVIGVWVLILVSLTAWSSAAGKHYAGAFEVPGTESQNALDMLDQRFAAATGATVNVIFTDKNGDITDEQSQISSVAEELAALSGVTSASDPFKPGNGTQISRNGQSAYISVQLDSNSPVQTATGEQSEVALSIMSAADTLQSQSLAVAYTGIPDAPATGADYTDLIGMGISLIVLIITFGSLLAAGMPLITAAIGVSISGSLLVVLSNFVTLSATTPLLGSMLGLAVGIDYALFIVSRHRSNLANGMSPKQSVAVSTATAGTAVVFAGLTVIIALLGLFVVGIPFLGMMGLGAAVAVVIAISIAITLVPAVLGAFGAKLVPKATSKAFAREQKDAPPTLGAKWGNRVTRKPALTVLVVLIALVTLALPAAQLRLTLPGAGYDAPGSITRTGYDTMTAEFGAGVSGPLLVVADISKTEVTDIESVLNALHDEFIGVRGVASVSPAVPNATLDTAIVVVTPTTGPNDAATEDLVNRLRAGEAKFEKANAFSYEITGSTAIGIDISARLSEAILPFGIVVVGLSLLLLMVVFRSLAVPLSATAGFVLSVLAAFGVSVAVFMWGWGADLFGVTKVGPVVSFMPILVMAVLFGLAMDYEVFLVSRMRERFVATRDPHRAVTEGFRASARVVTAAALIMFSVFFSFVPGSAALLQPVALALAVGVAIDALLVRMTLIPAVMSLLGNLAWALPRRIERRLPDMDIEGEKVQGRLETLAWQQNAEADIVIDAANLKISGTELPAMTFTARRGNLVVASVPTQVAGELFLAAVAGRADARGLLVSCGKPLPYDGVRVRKQSALVLDNVEVVESSVEQQIVTGLRMNSLAHDEAHVDATLTIAEALLGASGISGDGYRLNRSAEGLGQAQRSILELAIAVQCPIEVLAFDARIAAQKHAAKFISRVCDLTQANVTIVSVVSTDFEPGGLSLSRERELVRV